MNSKEDFKRYCEICKVPNDVKEKVLLVWEKRAIMNGQNTYRSTKGFVAHRVGRQFAEYQQALELGIQEGAWKSEILQNRRVDKIAWHMDSVKQQVILNKLRTETAKYASRFIEPYARDGTSLKDFMDYFAASLERQFKTLDYTEYLKKFLTDYSNFFDERRRRQEIDEAEHVMARKTGIPVGSRPPMGDYFLRF